VGDDGWWDNFIGWGRVTYPFSGSGYQWVYMGYTSNSYPYISIGAVTMGGNCTYNDILGDCVYFTG
jgi:hypothetical protein